MQTDLIDQLNRFSGMMLHVNMMFNRMFLQNSGVSFAHFNSLLYIHQVGCTKIQPLADHLGVTKAAVSQMIDKLVEADLVSRSEDTTDRRSKLICLTAKGGELLADIFRLRLQWVPDLVAGLPEADQISALRIFETLNKNLNQVLIKVNSALTSDNPCKD